MTRKKINIDFDFDLKFFAILPAININLHSKGLEFEWLFFGIYASVKKEEVIKESWESFH